jgi:hypothetical protein
MLAVAVDPDKDQLLLEVQAVAHPVALQSQEPITLAAEVGVVIQQARRAVMVAQVLLLYDILIQLQLRLQQQVHLT